MDSNRRNVDVLHDAAAPTSFVAANSSAATAAPSTPTVPANAVHKRSYQACVPCRERKVKCDLGSVDEPVDPPCVRCRREKKHCHFTETRRKRKTEDGGDFAEDNPDQAAHSKRLSVAGLNDYANGYGTPLVAAQGPPHFRTSVSALQRSPDPNVRVEGLEAGKLFQDPITGQSDTINMLVKASELTEKNDSAKARAQKAAASELYRAQYTGALADGMASAIDPALMNQQHGDVEVEDDPEVIAAVQAWSSLRFVRAGFFTVQEGVQYIQYFYDTMAPLTPVQIPNYKELRTHAQLLHNEPMLTVTLLTIASRYLKLSGPGQQSRSYKVHDQLWDFLQNMITRMFWGQDQFGFHKAGDSGQTPQEVEDRRRGLRSLGTAESLLLLSDWLPRAMHFNPISDDGELLITQRPPIDTKALQSPNNVHAAWTEPAARSSRMCWSLVSMAYGLAFELGIFDSLIESGCWRPGPQLKTAYDAERADRIGRMLLVYVTQTCGRLGFPNMMPPQASGGDNLNFLKMDVPIGHYPAPYDTITAGDRIQRAWAELTNLMRETNVNMFDSNRRTEDAVADGSYFGFLEKYNPLLRTFRERFDSTGVAGQAATMIKIEYEYARTFINSLALQAVINAMSAAKNEPEAKEPTEQDTPPALFSSKLVDVYHRNIFYINELISASRNILDLAARELGPTGLKHAPVRTHFRILAAAMFLLKSLALGGKEPEIWKTFKLLEDAINAMRASVTDDVHLALRISELLESLTTSLQSKLLRLAVPPRGGKRAGQAGASKAAVARPPAHNGEGPSSMDTTYNFYRDAGIDPPPLVDPNDPRVTIMPPSDFFAYRNDGPQSPTANLHSPSSEAFQRSAPLDYRATHQRNVSTSTASTDLRNAQALGQSPASTAGGYDWIALDFQRILDGSASPQATFAHASPSAGASRMPGAAAAATLAPDALPDYRHVMPGGMPGGPHPGFGGGMPGAPTPFTGGAFGPEIAENAEFLGALSGWFNPNNGGAGPGGVSNGNAPISGRGGPWNGAGNGHGDASMAE